MTPPAPTPRGDATPVRKLASGLEYIDVKGGKGTPAKARDRTSMHYTGWFVNGTRFGSSVDRGRPYGFYLGVGRVIQGWDEGIVGMDPGGVRNLIIPAHLGYGARPMDPIPANSTLIFEVQYLRRR